MRPDLKIALPFAIATLLPVPVLFVAALAGGGWSVLAAAGMALFVPLLDRLIASNAAAEGTEFPAATALSVTLGILHFPMLALGVVTLADAAGMVQAFAIWLAFGLWFGQVSNANAHELIHRPQRAQHRLGAAVYISLLFGHHTSAHRLVHHRHVATDADPNSARLGEGFYRFALRAWVGSFRGGLLAELQRDGQRKSGRLGNPYIAYVGGALLCLVLSVWLAGLAGALAYLALAGHAQMQLLLSDYVQHYGLQRHTGPAGPEPVAERHSWNAAPPVSGWQMLNAPRHSAHHARPTLPYPALHLPAAAEAPRLPRSLPVMATLALVPPLWHRVMDHRAARWRAQQPIVTS